MASNGHRGGKQRVLIAGGGIAGAEAALALPDLAADWVEVALRDPRREFVFRPFAGGEPYGAARIFRCDLGQLAERCDASFHADGIVSVDADRRLAVTRGGERLPYDHFVLASGVRMLWAVPGAATFWGVADEGQVGDVIAELRAGALRRLVLTMPAGCSWALPLYELALLSKSALDKAGVARTQITVATPEDIPLGLFGRHASEQIGRLLEERGIEVLAGANPVRFQAGRLTIASGAEIEADAVISLPRLEGRRIAGIPHDAGGFVRVDGQGRVIGLEHVYAAGDITTFPLKQGGIATQQADLVAEAIVAEIGAGPEPRPFDPILSGALWERRPAGRYLSPFLDSLAGLAENANSPSLR
jgi:sulfide:quinone oxidoreductase